MPANAQTSGEPTSPTLGIVIANAEAELRAHELSQLLGLPIHHDTATTGVQIEVSSRGIALREKIGRQSTTVRADFVHGRSGYRRYAVGGFKQPIARACGLRVGCRQVFDATAGLGQDAFLLACLGCTVTAVERHAVLHAMLLDGIERARLSADAVLLEILDRIDVRQAESRELLASMSPGDAPEVIYIDPMYPAAKQKAQVKKEMRLCRVVAGNDDDATELLAAARATSAKRVVVKRPRSAPPLAHTPTIQTPGRSVRYDVYLP